MNKRILIVPLLFAVVLAGAEAQTVSGRFVTSVLGWERQDDAAGNSTGHLRGYEQMQLSLSAGNFSFSTSMLGSTDFGEQMENDPQLRLFNASLLWKNIGGLADLKLGRQAIFGGVNYGTIDGAHLRLRPADGVEVIGYAGGLTPPSQRTDFFHNLDHNWQAGAHVLLYLIPDVKLGLSYMNRHRETTPFQALRLDGQLAPFTTTVDYGSRANQYGSLDAAYTRGDLWLFGRVDYDFNFERMSRAELAATYQVSPTLGLSLDLAHREPTIAWNSYFALLESSANQEAVLGIDYRVLPRLTLHARVSTVMYDDESAARVSLGASNKYASIMYTKDVSYDGDLDAFNLNLTYPVFDGMFVPHIGAVYSSYALAENLEKTSTWAAVAGAMVRPWPVLSFDVQGQYMTNKIYKSDMRVFARANFWFSEVFGAAKQEGRP
ncbi:MAG: hypothetical protein HY962_02055 [Ignavibacteriae bacterium]|nr:hypothetical protein [Ignavibacteriota bacterium]